jgi:hypothetical protein
MPIRREGLLTENDCFARNGLIDPRGERGSGTRRATARFPATGAVLQANATGRATQKQKRGPARQGL